MNRIYPELIHKLYPHAKIQWCIFHLHKIIWKELQDEFGKNIPLVQLNNAYMLFNIFFNHTPELEKLKEFLKKYDEQKTRDEKNNTETIKFITLDLFLNSQKTKNICKSKKESSCFSYTCKKNAAQIHFSNAVVPKNPLKDEEFENRRAELTQIAAEIKNTHPEVKRLTGGSWLRNLETYLQLFPPEHRNTIEYESSKRRNQYGPMGAIL